MNEQPATIIEFILVRHGRFFVSTGNVHNARLLTLNVVGILYLCEVQVHIHQKEVAICNTAHQKGREALRLLDEYIQKIIKKRKKVDPFSIVKFEYLDQF